jgi:hypothetical protein
MSILFFLCIVVSTHDDSYAIKARKGLPEANDFRKFIREL